MAVSAPTSPDPSNLAALSSATCEHLHQLHPERYSPTIRASVAAHALYSGRGRIKSASTALKAGNSAAADAATAEAHGWMREYWRWRMNERPSGRPSKRVSRPHMAPHPRLPSGHP